MIWQFIPVFYALLAEIVSDRSKHLLLKCTILLRSIAVRKFFYKKHLTVRSNYYFHVNNPISSQVIFWSHYYCTYVICISPEVESQLHFLINFLFGRILIEPKFPKLPSTSHHESC